MQRGRRLRPAPSGHGLLDGKPGALGVDGCVRQSYPFPLVGRRECSSVGESKPKQSRLRPPPAVVVVMGVSGSGKSTIGEMLARRLGWEFAEGDAFHSAANVDRMRAGVPLNHPHRWPWLLRVAEWIDSVRRVGGHGVIACSALKRSYRALIVGEHADVRLVYLQGNRVLIGQRQAARKGHFMPASLVESQFRTLEEPSQDEDPIIVSVAHGPCELVERICSSLVAQSESFDRCRRSQGGRSGADRRSDQDGTREP